MARIAGVKSLYIAPLTMTEGVPSWGTPIEIPQFISFSGSKNFSDFQWYSNDTVENSYKQLTDVSLEITVGNISSKLKAMLTGATYDEETGVYLDSTTDSAQEFALISVLSQLDAGKTGTLNQVYYRCALNVDGIEATTKTDSVTDSQVTITGKAIPLPNGKFGATVDSFDENVNEEVLKGWTTKVFYPEA